MVPGHAVILTLDQIPVTNHLGVNARTTDRAGTSDQRQSGDDNSDSGIGPMPAQDYKPTISENGLGSVDRSGEGMLSSGFMQSGDRIPRRGEIGMDLNKIEQWENAGYVMSGNRRSRVNDTHVHREGQVITADEKRQMLLQNQEERQKKESQIISEFRLEAHEFTSLTLEVGASRIPQQAITVNACIEKVDTSGELQSRMPLARMMVAGYVCSLQRYSKALDVASVGVHLFARAQPEYLFAKSQHNPGKHTLDDIGLSWTVAMLLEMLAVSEECGSGHRTAYFSVMLPIATTKLSELPRCEETADQGSLSFEDYDQVLVTIFDRDMDFSATDAAKTSSRRFTEFIDQKFDIPVVAVTTNGPAIAHKPLAAAPSTPPAVNDLSSMVRKKRKVTK
ncbi:hypothetical protein GGF49_001631 [Coemansia sp. RSA 1853]|nr:hypothetical protein GGF49_001631 [Coemansia sp. RSA 1853]